jgi:hypothetical protein
MRPATTKWLWRTCGLPPCPICFVNTQRAWIIDPAASRRFLQQFLATVPANKLFAFGGDYRYAEPVYGHLRIARDGIARALSEFVEDEYFTKDEAIAVAHRILHDNAAVFFRVDTKVEALGANLGNCQPGCVMRCAPQSGMTKQ